MRNALSPEGPSHLGTGWPAAPESCERGTAGPRAAPVPSGCPAAAPRSWARSQPGASGGQGPASPGTKWVRGSAAERSSWRCHRGPAARHPPPGPQPCPQRRSHQDRVAQADERDLAQTGLIATTLRLVGGTFCPQNGAPRPLGVSRRRPRAAAGASGASAMTPRAARPGARRCRGCPASPQLCWACREGAGAARPPAKRIRCPRKPPRRGAVPLRSAPRPRPGGARSAPRLRGTRSGFSKPLRFRQTGALASKKPQSVSTAFAQRYRPIRMARSLYPALRGQAPLTAASAWQPC